MIVPFSEMSNDSKIWIYQSNRKFIDTELDEINDLIIKFLNTWTAHGSELLTSFEIKYNRFIIIALNESVKPATGCSIDTLYNEIKKLEQLFKLDFLDSSILYLKINEEIKSIVFTEIQNIEDSNTLFFDTTIKKKKEIDNWLIPIKDGWCNAFIK